MGAPISWSLRFRRTLPFWRAPSAGTLAGIITVRSTGATFRSLSGSPHSVPTILPTTERAAKEIPKRITFAAARPYRG